MCQNWYNWLSHCRTVFSADFANLMVYSRSFCVSCWFQPVNWHGLSGLPVWNWSLMSVFHFACDLPVAWPFSTCFQQPNQLYTVDQPSWPAQLTSPVDQPSWPAQLTTMPYTFLIFYKACNFLNHHVDLPGIISDKYYQVVDCFFIWIKNTVIRWERLLLIISVCTLLHNMHTHTHTHTHTPPHTLPHTPTHTYTCTHTVTVLVLVMGGPPTWWYGVCPS